MKYVCAYMSIKAYVLAYLGSNNTFTFFLKLEMAFMLPTILSVMYAFSVY